MINTMNIIEMKIALDEAQRTLDAADKLTESMILLCQGRLRKVTTWRGEQALMKLKKELKSFNAHTGEWKD